MRDVGMVAIQLRGIGVRRGNRRLLRGIDWTVEEGTCAAILGPNGSGKSTLARILAAHLYPTEGECHILGQTFGDCDLRALRRRIRLVQGVGPLEIEPTLSVLEVVLTGLFGTEGLYDPTTETSRRRARRILRDLGLGRIARQPYGTLSQGERMRCLIGRALIVRPSLLILDEVTAGLDLLGREQVLATVQRLLTADTALTIVMITHHIEELPQTTRQILLLCEGKAVAAGSPGKVFKDRILSRTYQFPLKVHHIDGRYTVRAHPAAWRGLLSGRAAL